MIALFLAWSILLFVSYTFGSIAKKICNLFWKQNTQQWNIIDLSLLGLCMISGLANIFHIFIPADTNMMFILLMLGVLYWFCAGKSLFSDGQKAFDYIASFPKRYLVLFVGIVLLLALFCCLYPRMTDTLYYHYQNLLWNNAYPTVPGLANLQPRLGFNSNLYLLTSTFGCYSLYDQFIFSVHTLLLTMMMVWIVGKTIIGQVTLRKVIVLLMFVCFVVIYKIHITSVTSDFFANLLVLYLFLNLILDEKIIDAKPFLFLIVPVFIVTIKLSCAPIVILSIYILYRQYKIKHFLHSLLCLVIFGLWIIAPWCYNTYLLSGYLFFPLPYFDFFNPDWKVPMYYLIEQKEFIQAFAKYPNNLDIHSILQMSISEWFPIWWQSDMFYYNNIANRFFFFALLICIPIGITLLCQYKKRQNLTLTITWLISLINIIIWFLNAPDFRFVYAFILNLVFVTLLIIVEYLPQSISSNYIKKGGIYFTYAIILYYLIFCGRWIYYQRGEDVTILALLEKPTPIAYIRHYKGANKYVEDTSTGFTIYRNSFSDLALLCYDYPLPSSSDFVGGIEMRGKSLSDGFRCKPNATLRRTY